MNFGKLLNEPFEEYFANEAVGSHRLNDVLPRPRVYFEKYIAKTAPDRADSPAFVFGRMFHCLALEGEAEVSKRFAVAPKCDRRTTKGKEDYAAFLAASAGKQAVAQDDIDLAWQMLGGIRAKSSAVKLLSRGAPEVTFRHQLAAFAVQARVDWFDGDDPAGPLCVNVKTVETLEDFDKQYLNYHYYRGDAFYRMVVAKVLGVESFVPQMVNLVVEKSAPFECAIRVPDAEALNVGAREVMERLSVIASCYTSGAWPGEPDEPRPISLPTWKTKEAA
jgi:exodeoxyribonuclease VIII